MALLREGHNRYGAILRDDFASLIASHISTRIIQSIPFLGSMRTQATYRIMNIQRVVLYKSRLYAWCDLADQAGDLYQRQLLGINAQTGAVEWNPQTGHRIDVETGGLAVLGRKLFVVGRMNTVNGQPSTRYSLSYNLDTHQLTNWNPLNTIDLECGNCACHHSKDRE